MVILVLHMELSKIYWKNSETFENVLEKLGNFLKFIGKTRKRSKTKRRSAIFLVILVLHMELSKMY